MIKQFALFLLLLTAPAFSQGVGGGGVPGAPVAALPTATAAGQVPVSTGPGTAYTAQTLATGQAILPGTPTAVYSFIAPGDQTGQTVHDISGNGNNGSISQPTSGGNYWTGTGFNASLNSTGLAIFTPMAAGTNQTHCFTVYIPFYGVAGSNNVNGQLLLSTGGGRGYYVTETGAQAYGAQAFQDLINNGGGTTLDTLPVETGFHTRCIQFRSGQTNRIFIDGIETSYASTSTDVFSGTWALAYVTTANVNVTFYYYATWTSITDAQILQASLAMNAAVAARGVQTTPVNLLTGKAVIHSQGDSITCCAGATTTQWYPTLLSVSSVYSSVVNEGFPGAPVLTFAEAAKWRDTPSCSSGSSPTLVTIFGGTNDGFFGATAQTTFNFIQYDVATLRAAGCQVGVATMLSRTALDTFKDQLNPLIRAGAGPNTYFLIDTDDPHLQCDGCYSNTTYFNTDQVHPTNTGQTLLAAAFSNSINANGIGAATAAAPNAYTGTTNTMVSADRFATMNNASATAATLPDCIGVGVPYQITNLGAGTVTFSGKTSEAITGSATLAQNLVAIFQPQIISQSAAGCGWQRIQ